MKLFQFTLISCLFFSASFCYGQESPRKKINFDEIGNFISEMLQILRKISITVSPLFLQNQEPLQEQLLIARFNDSTWRTLNVPHDWAVELPFVNFPNFEVESHGYKPVGGLFPETSIGWYRKHFTSIKG